MGYFATQRKKEKIYTLNYINITNNRMQQQKSENINNNKKCNLCNK